MADPRIRQITIKTGIVKRLTKEKIMYEKEAKLQENRVEKLRAAAEDEYMLRKQEEVLRECLMMVPDTQRRLGKAFEELNEYLKNEDELKECEQFAAARNILEEAKLQLA